MRKFSLSLLCVLTLSLAVRAGEAQKTPPVAEVLPEGTIMFAEIAPWAQWSKDFDKTALAKIFSEPEVRQFLAGPFSQISYLIKQATKPAVEKPALPEPPPPAKPDQNNVFNSLLTVLQTFSPGPFTAAVRFSPEDAQAKRQPAVALMLGVSEGSGAENAGNMIALMADNIIRSLRIEKVVITDYQNTKILSIKAWNDSGLAAAVHKGRLIFTNEVKFMTQIIDGMAGTNPKRLADTDTYKNTGLTGTEHLIAFLDIAGLKAALGAIEKPAADAPNQLDEFFVLAGLNKSISVAWSMRMKGPSFESRTAIFSQGEREGFLSTLDEEPVSMDALKLCPKSTPLAAGFRLRPDKVMPFLRNAVKAIEGKEGVARLNEIEKQLNDQLKRDLEKDVQAAYGNELVITSLAGMNDAGAFGEVSAFAASLSVKDLAKAEELLVQLLTRATEKKEGNDADAVAVKELDHDGIKIRYLTPARALGFFKVSPAFAFTQNRLVVALDVLTLKRALKGLKEGGSLVDSEAFKTALGQLDNKMGPVFSYVDWGNLYSRTFNLTATMLQLIAPTDILKEIGIDLNLLPATETVSQHLFPGLSIAHLRPNGVMMVSRGPLPSLEVLSPPAAAVTAIFASFRPFLVQAAGQKPEEKK